MHIDFDKQDLDRAVLLVREWLSATQPRVLNVAGPRASHEPEIYSKVKCVLVGALAAKHEARQVPAEAEG